MINEMKFNEDVAMMCGLQELVGKVRANAILG